MTLYIADSNVYQQATQIDSNLDELASICEELGQVLERVTMEGGGLDSAKMREAMQQRALEAKHIAETIRGLRDQAHLEAAYYLREIERIDSYLY